MAQLPKHLFFSLVGLGLLTCFCAFTAISIREHVYSDSEYPVGKGPSLHIWDKLKGHVWGAVPVVKPALKEALLSNGEQNGSRQEATTIVVGDVGDAEVAGRSSAFQETADEIAETRESFSLLLISSLLLVTFLMAYLVREAHLEVFHESGGAILLGVAVGGLIRTLSGVEWLQSFTMFDTEVFFLFFLPPIIFEAGYNMNRRFFFKNALSLGLFAFVGTLISTFVFGFILFFSNSIIPHHDLKFLECLAFGALISATDPVTVLAIFKELHVDVDLYANVFGESVLNDAIAIVLYRTVSTFLYIGQVTGVKLALATSFFALIFFGSLAVGIFIGLLAALLFKYTDMWRHEVLEGATLLVLSYTSYLIAEGFELSGIVAILFCGITMSHYMYPNLSHSTKEFSRHVVEVASFIMETLIFSYLGFSMFSFAQEYNAAIIIVSLVACFVGRALNIFPMSFLVNTVRSEHPIPMNHQLMMWFAGLRGAIAFSLALDARDTTINGEVILTTTLVIVMFTVMLLGGSTTKVLQFLKIKCGHDSSVMRQPYHHSFLDLDKMYLQPMFTREHWGSHPANGGHGGHGTPHGSVEMKVMENQYPDEMEEIPIDSDSEYDISRRRVSHESTRPDREGMARVAVTSDGEAEI